MGDQAEMLHTARRIDDDEVVFVRLPNFLELRYEVPEVSAMAQRATADEVASLCARPIFLSRDMNRPRLVPGTSSVTG